MKQIFPTQHTKKQQTQIGLLQVPRQDCLFEETVIYISGEKILRMLRQ